MTSIFAKAFALHEKMKASGQRTSSAAILNTLRNVLEPLALSSIPASGTSTKLQWVKIMEIERSLSSLQYLVPIDTMDEDTQATRLVKTVFPDLWAWSQFAHRTCVKNTKRHGAAGFGIAMQIVGTVLMYFTAAGSSHLPAPFSVLLDYHLTIWTSGRKVASRWKGNPHTAMAHAFGTSLFAFLKSTADKDRTVVWNMVNETCDSLVTHIVAELKADIEDTDPVVGCMSLDCIGIVCTLNRLHSPKFIMALRRAGFTKLMMTVLLNFCIDKPAPGMADVMESRRYTCILACLQTITDGLVGYNARTWFIELLKADFLKCIDYIGRWTTRPEIQEHVQYILELTESYLVYHSVLLAIEPALKDLLEPFRRFEPWPCWLKLVFGKLDVLRNRYPLHAVNIGCLNDGCSRRSDPRHMHQCDGCAGYGLIARYCSKQCQRQDRPQHRVLCRHAKTEYEALSKRTSVMQKLPSKAFEYLREPLLKSDRGYLSFLADCTFLEQAATNMPLYRECERRGTIYSFYITTDVPARRDKLMLAVGSASTYFSAACTRYQRPLLQVMFAQGGHGGRLTLLMRPNLQNNASLNDIMRRCKSE